jgi:hypothetical protein
VATRTIAPNYLPVILMTQPNPDKFHQEQNTTLAWRSGAKKVNGRGASEALAKFVGYPS